MATYAGRYNKPLQDRYGNGYRNALVAVQTLAAAPVTLYADRDKTAYTPASGLAANEIKADNKGNLIFFADPGNYQIVVTPVGGSTLAAFPVSVLPDPLEPDASESALQAEEDARIAADALKLDKDANLSDVPDPAEARGNLGLRGAVRYEMASTYATGGSGTVAEPWTHADGTGGIKAAIDASVVSGLSPKIDVGYFHVTANVDNLRSNLTIHTDGAASVIVGPDDPTAGVGGVRIEVYGTEEEPIVNCHVGGLHFIRLNPNQKSTVCVATEHAHYCSVGDLSAEGGGDRLLFPRTNTRWCRFGDVIAWGGEDCNVFQGGEGNISDLQFGRIINDSGTECADFWGAENIQIQMLYGRNLIDEVLDMGSCSKFQVDQIIAVGCERTIQFKHERDLDSNYNIFDSVISLDGTFADGCALSVSGPGSYTGRTMLGNSINQLVCVTSAPNTKAVRITSSPEHGLVEWAIRDFYIESDAHSIHYFGTGSAHIDVQRGYARSATTEAIFLDGGSTHSLIDPVVRDVRATSLLLDAIFISRPKGWLVAEDNHVLGAGKYGIETVVLDQTNGFKGGSVAHNKISECARSGYRFTTTRGVVAHLDVKDNVVWNCLLNAATVTNRDAAISWESAGGSGSLMGPAIDGNRIFDTQAVKTTKAFMFSLARNYYTRRNNTVMQVAAVFATDHNATEGANSVVANNLEVTGP